MVGVQKKSVCVEKGGEGREKRRDTFTAEEM